MKKASVFLAPGFEELEGLTVVDLLRRAGVEVTMVSIEETRSITGSHGITVEADRLFGEMDYADQDLLVLPGGMPGTTNLKNCDRLLELLHSFHKQGKMLAAICAAPTVFGHMGILEGKKATCYPGCEDGLGGADFLAQRVVVDGNITTSRGVGTAISFALSLIEQLYDKEKAETIRSSIVYGH